MTDAQFTAWLSDQSAVRAILVEVAVRVSGVETTRYLSTVGYTTSPSDTPSNQFFTPRIIGGVEFSESISSDGAPSLQYGDLELSNADGEIDSWLDDIWVNRAITVYIGDAGWDRTDFRVIFSGIVADVSSRARDVINIQMRDKLQRLNTPLSDVKLGGASKNADKLLPLAFGECVNIKPLLTSIATHEYQFHNGNSERVIEVRDNGVPVTSVDALASGKFTLSAQPAGVITTSVQGDKPTIYSNTIADLVERMVTGFGKVTGRFSAGDLDTANLSAFNTANPQPVGYYSAKRVNVITAIQHLAGSVGAQVVMSRAGLMQLIKIELPAVGSPVEITADNMVERELFIAERWPVIAAAKIAYCKNQTVQQNLQTGIPDDHKALFEDAWLTKTSSDGAVAAIYMLDDEPAQKETALVVGSDAQTEAARLLDLSKTPRAVYEFTGYADLFELALGQAVTITHSRFGLSGGKTGMVVRLRPNWSTMRVTVGVLI